MPEQVLEGRYADTANPLSYDPYFVAITTLLILLTILVNLIYIFASRIFGALSKLRRLSLPSQDCKKAPQPQSATIYASKKGLLRGPSAPSFGQLKGLDDPIASNRGRSGVFGRIIVPEMPPAGNLKANVPRDTVPLKTHRQVLSQLEEMTESWRHVKEELERLRTGNRV